MRAFASATAGAVGEAPQRVELRVGQHRAAAVVERDQADELAVRVQRPHETQPILERVLLDQNLVAVVREPVERARRPACLARLAAQPLLERRRSDPEPRACTKRHLESAAVIGLVERQRLVGRDHLRAVCGCGPHLLERMRRQQDLDHRHQGLRRPLRFTLALAGHLGLTVRGTWEADYPHQ